MKPCRACPFLKDAPPGLWEPAHYLLIAYLGSVRSYVDKRDARMMGCHKFNGVVGPKPEHPPLCGGWLRAAQDGIALTLALRMGRLDAEAAEEMDDGVPVLSVEEMARVNGLDVDRLPPLDWSPDVRDRYPHPDDWAREVHDLRSRLERDPAAAREFVVPGSPLDVGVSDKVVAEALGQEAAVKYGRYP